MAEALQGNQRLPLMERVRILMGQHKITLVQAVEILYQNYRQWESQQDQADTENLYADLREHFGEWTVGIGINDQGNLSAEAFRKLEAAYYTGFAQSCIAICIYEDNVGCGAAHYNSITPAAVKRRFKKLLSTDQNNARALAENDGLLIAAGKRAELLLLQTTTEDRTRTASFTLHAALEQFLQLPGAKGYRHSAQIRGIGLFYLPKNEISLIENQSKSLLQKEGFNPKNLIMKLGHEGGFMYGPYNRHFSTPRFYP